MILLICSVWLGSCDKQIIDIAAEDRVPSKVYFMVDNLDSYQIRQIDYLDVGETTGTFTLAICKSGVLKDPVSVRIGELTEEELAEYNEENGQDFVLMPPKAYNLPRREFTFSGSYDDLSQTVDIVFDMEQLRTMDERSVLPLTIRQTSAEINVDKSLVILKPQIQEVQIAFADGGGDVSYTDNESLQRDIRISLEALLDLAENEWDIDVELMVDETYVEEYNRQHSTSYKLLTEEQYSLETSGTIEAGKTSTTFLLEIEREQVAEAGRYMLPVRLKSSSRFTVDENSLYCIRIDIYGAKLDRTGWDVVLYNTSEPGEDGGGKYPLYGHPEAILDGNPASYWHSAWRETQTPLPHYLVIDMLEEHFIEQIEWLPREGRATCKDVEIYIGDDIAPLEGLEESSLTEIQAALADASWKKVATVQLPNDATSQIFDVSPATGRFLMLLITSNFRGDTVSSIAEIYPYGG